MVKMYLPPLGGWLRGGNEYYREYLMAKTEISREELDKKANALHCDYMDNVFVYLKKTMVMNPYTGERLAPDEKLMRDIEEFADVPEQGADDFRRTQAAFIGQLAHQNKRQWWDCEPHLARAILEYLNVIRGGDKPQPARGGRSVLRPAEACPVVKPPNRTASCSTQSFLL
jgi:hypothetical protein